MKNATERTPERQAGHTPGPMQANARLIAAAPELLEACKRLELSLAGLPEYLNQHDSPIIAKVAAERLAFARAAIAKAEGRT